MKHLFAIIVSLGMATGCASSEHQVREVLRNNPKIVFDIIEEHPDEFIDLVNRAAKQTQAKRYQEQVAEMKAAQEEDLKNPKKPQLVDDRRLVGNNQGKIVIVEYADFQCPACRMAYNSLNEFKEKYANDIQFYYKNMPLDFHPMALPAAKYFEAIRLQDKSKARKFYDYVYQNQDQLAKESFLDRAAKASGANLNQLAKDVDSEKIKNLVAKDMTEFQKFGFTGTPVIILNGVALHGAPKLEDLERIAKLTQ